MSKIRAFELDDGTRVPLMIECPECHGDKRVGPYDSAPHIETGWKTCLTCDGSGEVRNDKLEWQLQWQPEVSSLTGLTLAENERTWEIHHGPTSQVSYARFNCRWVALGATP